MKVDYTDEGVPVIEEALINLLDNVDEEIVPNFKVAESMNEVAAQAIWLLGQNEHKFHAPRLQGLFNEMLADLGERADDALMP